VSSLWCFCILAMPIATPRLRAASTGYIQLPRVLQSMFSSLHLFRWFCCKNANYNDLSPRRAATFFLLLRPFLSPEWRRMPGRHLVKSSLFSSYCLDTPEAKSNGYDCSLPHDAMLVRYMYMSWPCVRLSVTSWSSAKQINESSWVLARELFPPFLHCVIRKFWYV